MQSHFDWERVFKTLTEHPPFPWQRLLYEWLRRGEIPSSCDIPTGLGKTMVIVLWLIAIVEQSLRGKVLLPRRLVYIVDRRTASILNICG